MGQDPSETGRKESEVNFTASMVGLRFYFI